MERHVSFCRLCAPQCGLLVDIADGRVARVTGDPEHPLTRGFTCEKGRRYGDLHHDPGRILETQGRASGRDHQPIGEEQAVAEIAARLQKIIDEDGPDAIGMFIGTQAYTASLTYAFAGAWLRAIGSAKRFTTNTLDQSAKDVAVGRLGQWLGGNQLFEDADVWLVIGSNPPVSMQGGGAAGGYPIHDGLRRVAEARARGLELIVVDPRRTEAAAHADLHLQPVPGTDATLLAGLLHVVLAEGLHDPEFCDRWVDGLDALRAAVSEVTPERVQAVCGVPATDLVEAARLFGRAGVGQARSGTGIDMGPHANVAEHLVQTLNVVCGRFPRPGDRVYSGGVLGGPVRVVAEAASPARPWEGAFVTRTGVSGLGREIPAAAMVDDITSTAGGVRLRALVVVGGNPASCFPDTDRIVDALGRLDLLVTIDPLWSETARLADYVIAPTLGFERWDDTRSLEHHSIEPFGQVAAPILEPPAGVVEDWQFLFDLGQAMGLTLRIGSRVLSPEMERPTSLEMLASFAERGAVLHEELRGHPHGAVFRGIEPDRVAPAASGAAGRFELLAPDVAAELAAALADDTVPARAPFLLVVRRGRRSMNSVGRRQPGVPPVNPLGVHPADLDDLWVGEGAVVTVRSEHGAASVVVQADDTLRRGVVSLVHGYGDLPLVGDVTTVGTNPNALLALDRDLQPISLMPRLTAVPVWIEGSNRPSDDS